MSVGVGVLVAVVGCWRRRLGRGRGVGRGRRIGRRWWRVFADHLERLGVPLTVVAVVPALLSRKGDARDGERHEHDEAQQQREMPT